MKKEDIETIQIHLRQKTVLYVLTGLAISLLLTVLLSRLQIDFPLSRSMIISVSVSVICGTCRSLLQITGRHITPIRVRRQLKTSA